MAWITLDASVASVAAVTLTPAIMGQVVPPAHQGPNPADRRRYERAVAAAGIMGLVLSIAAQDAAPLVLAVGAAGLLVGFREWAMQPRDAEHG